MSDFLKTLFENKELTEDFKQNISESFNSAVSSAVEVETVKITESLTEKHNAEISVLVETHTKEVEELSAQLEENVQKYINDEVLPTIDNYLSEAAKQFIDENKDKVESELKVQIAENLIKGVGVFIKESNITLDDEKLELVEQKQTELDEVKQKLDESVDLAITLRKEITSLKSNQIIESVVSNLTETQKEKVIPLFEGITFKDEAQFKTAITSIVESYFPVVPKVAEPELEPKVEDKKPITESTSYENELLEYTKGLLSAVPGLKKV